jgi:methionyl-tRNA formyltransferase
LLPRWRGAAPIHRAIQAGDTETGVTIMQMAAGLDTGNMLLKIKTPIGADDTGQTLHDRLAKEGASALIKVLDLLQQDQLSPEVQDDSLSTYAQKLNKAEAEIDWTQSAQQIDRTIRAFNPWPVAFTLLNGKPLRIFMSKVADASSSEAAGSVIKESTEGIQVATGDGVLEISKLQLPGKKAMDVSDFLHGRSLMGSKFPS